MSVNEIPNEIPDVFEPLGSRVYHYTKLTTALEDILPDWTLKMSPFSEMRDPRESQLLGVEGVGDVAEDWTAAKEDLARFAEFDRKAKELKDRVKVLALTRDDLSKPDEVSAVYGYGFAHPRLWEQYGDGHRGVCFCLDRQTLIDKASHNLRHRGKLEFGEVRYVDNEIAPEARSVIVAALRTRAVSTVLDEHVKTHLSELFFTKLTDWESEVEYRLVLVTSEDDECPEGPKRKVLVGIQDALRAIVLGAGVSDVYLPSFEKLCGERAVPIFKVEWPNGRPRLDPKTPPA